VEQQVVVFSLVEQEQSIKDMRVVLLFMLVLTMAVVEEAVLAL
jgi:hypothetical protein